MAQRSNPLVLVSGLCVCVLLACATPPPLIDAAARGDSAELDRLLAAGARPGTRKQDGTTGLHAAARRGHLQVARALMDAGLDANVKTSDGVTPLMLAVRDRRLEMVELLISRGADVNAQDRDRESPLLTAAERGDVAIAEILLEAKADPNARDKDRETPLWRAVKDRRVELSELLIEHGASVDTPDRNGEPPLLLAVKQREAELVKLLLEAGARPDRVSRDRARPLHTAVDQRDLESAGLLLVAGADANRADLSGIPPLLKSVRSRDRDLVELLLESGADPNAVDSSGTTPLVAAVQARDLEVAETLLEHRASVDAAGPNGAKPIVIATQSNDAAMVALLLEHGAEADSIDVELADPAAFARKYGYAALAKAMVDQSLGQALGGARPAKDTPTQPGPPGTSGSSPGSPQASKTVTPIETPKATPQGYEPYYSKRIAVVIGIDAYTQYPHLEGASRDARRVAAALRKLGFDEVIEILDRDATRTGLLRVLGSDLARKTDREAIALIYYAGHGETETLPGGEKRGYIVPVDADPEDSFATAISMASLRDLSRRLPAKQIYYAMDSCYSGLGLVRGVRPARRPGEDYVRKITSMRAVQMITAGAEGEQAMELGGQGLFTSYFLRALEGEADYDDNGFVTASEIGTYVRPQVTTASGTRQTPQFGTLEGAGEVAFRVRAAR